jgi:hypothetical protein
VIDGDGNPATTNDQTAIPEVAGEVGLFCKDELLLGTYKVLETVAPAGYSGAGPAQTVLVTAASTCGDREADDTDATFENMAEPTIVTQAQTPVTVGETITDTATLSGGHNPTGVITFNAYLDDECTAPAAFTDTEPVDGNGDYTSDPYTTEGTGTVYWIASYGGDLNNEAASGACGDENESSSVTPASPGIATTPRLLPNDSATLSGGFGTLTGTISFALFANADCTGTAMYTQGPIAVNGYGPYTTTNTSVFITADGTYSWEVTYSGDGNNNGAFSSCEAEQQVVDFTPLNLVP